ncbi:unnamed protein product [Lymnaea stagnalis]|uniref:C2H2-type domain-containing protein n=1 Tax=Lymnaea stagnalis TaxID=6523 RepID=A0AAV2I2Y0_LYMST
MFSRLRYMRRHQSTHRTERTHLCDNCGKSFKTKAILVAHRRSHKSKSYHCPQCNFISSSSAAIHIHRQLHPNGSVICEVCGNAYIDKSTLNKHMKVHDFNRPYPCTHPGCTWRFKTDVMRKAHVRSHTTIGKFSCTTCGYNFRQKHHLQRHIAKIHNGHQLKNGLSSNSLMSSSVLNLTSPSAMTDFSTQNLSVAHEILLGTSTEADLLKTHTDSHNSLIPSGVINTQSDVFSPSTSQLLCSISNTPFQSNLVDSEHPMIEVLVGDKIDGIDCQESEGKMMSEEMTTGSLSNLEYITDTGEVLQLVRPGQTYMSRDEHGNLVQYKIADVEDQDESSHPIYLIGVDGTVVGAANSQEQALLVNTDV